LKVKGNVKGTVGLSALDDISSSRHSSPDGAVTDCGDNI